MFTLPQLKNHCKHKLTAQEGARVRRIATAEFVSKFDNSYSEVGLLVATNAGDLSVYSLPDPRKQILVNCMKREDIRSDISLYFIVLYHSVWLLWYRFSLVIVPSPQFEGIQKT